MIVSRGLRGAEPSISREIAASKAAWPAVVQGLPPQLSAPARRAISTAALRTQQIATPRFISYAGELTGASSAIAGLLLAYEGLVQRGWSFTLAAARAGSWTTNSSLAGPSTKAPGNSAAGTTNTTFSGNGPGGISRTLDRQLASASPAAARFLRANANLYIGCVYDGHHNLTTIGKDLLLAYARLGGAASFGRSLSKSRVESIAGFYSPTNAGLTPQPPQLPSGS